jgi:thiol:disulfide interchange protein DsbC
MLRAIALVLCLLPGHLSANEAAIRKALEPKLGGARIEAVQPAPVRGLYEVRFRTAEGIQILYTDAEARHVIQGNIYDLRAGRDLTEERLRKLSAIDFGALPLGQAVKIQRGNGKRILAIFSDPYCPACKRFEGELQGVNDITIYVFMYPVIRPDLSEHSKAVWCSADRGLAWLDLVLRGKRPPAKAACQDPVEKNLRLGRGLHVNATPTLIFANGERHSGGLAIPQLEERLDHAIAADAQRR